MPPAQSPPNGPPKAKGPSRDWGQLRRRAATIGSIAGLFLFLIAAGSIAGYFYSQSKKQAPSAKTPGIQALTQQDIDKLSEIGSNLGTANQTLNIGANALFRGKEDITGDLTVGGRLNANGAALAAPFFFV